MGVCSCNLSDQHHIFCPQWQTRGYKTSKGAHHFTFIFILNYISSKNKGGKQHLPHWSQYRPRYITWIGSTHWLRRGLQLFWVVMLSLALLGSVCYQSSGNNSWDESCVCVCVLEDGGGLSRQAAPSPLTLQVELREVCVFCHVCVKGSPWSVRPLVALWS